METANARTQSWARRCGIALLVLGTGLLPLGAATAAEPGSGLAAALRGPGLGCAPAESTTGTSLLGRVRHARRAPQRAAKPRPPMEAAAAPGTAVGEPAHLLRAFYTCAGTARAPMPVGAGWLAVGPVRRS
jgi:hypothetical protein